MLSRILVVDPEENCHELFKRLADEGGLGPTIYLDHAYNGQGAYRLATKARMAGRPYDRIFVASKLPPGWSGQETINQIWSQESSEKLVLMGMAQPLSETISHKCELIAKPLTRRVLMQILQEAQSPAQIVEIKGLKAEAQTPGNLFAMKAMGLMNEEIMESLQSLDKWMEKLSSTSLSPEQADLIKHMAKAAGKSKSIASKACELSAMETGLWVQNKSAFSFSNFLVNLKLKLNSKNVDFLIENQIPSTFSDTAWGNSAMLENMLTTLVTGAAENGGTGPLIIQTDREGDYIFTVIDPYEKEDINTVKTYFQPSALNLAKSNWDLILATKAIHLEKGRLLVEACESGGIKWQLELALRETPEEKAGAGKKILLVEDNPTNIKIVKLHLNHAGYEVSVAENGKLAIEKALETHFNLILMDLQMPDMNGFTITRRIRKHTQDSVPIIALTANVFGDHRVKSFEAGMVDFIAKPIRRDAFLKTIEKWIGPAYGKPKQDFRPSPIIHQSESPTVRSCLCANLDRVLDYRRLLYEFQDDKDLVKSVVKEFVLNTENQLKAILKALMGDDLKTAHNQAHSLKGGGSNLCAMPFALAASELEEACEKEDSTRISGALMKLNREFKCLTEVIKFHEHLSL